MLKKIKLLIANNIHLCRILKADGIYISANNYNLRYASYKKLNLEIIGAAHNRKEILINLAVDYRRPLYVSTNFSTFLKSK